MSENIVQIKIDGSPAETSDESLLSRKTLHQNIFGKLRPVPFQYHWTVWFDKHDKTSSASSTSSTSTSTSSTPSTTSSSGSGSSSSSDTSAQSQQYTSRLTVLYEDVSDIAIFYRIYNNFPWDRIRLRDTVHIFRQGVKPVWEDPENCNGGCWTFRVPKAKGQEFFHEVAILTMGNELQAAVEGEHDHVLGVSISIRFNTYLISIWNKLGSNKTSIDILEHTILDRLSPELRPTNVVASSSYFYKRHADHDGFCEAVGKSSSSHQS